MKKFRIVYFILLACIWYWIIVINLKTHFMRDGNDYMHKAISAFDNNEMNEYEGYKISANICYEKSENVIKWLPKFLRP